MKIILTFTLLLLSYGLIAQDKTKSDQNPNYNISYQKYLKQIDNYTAKQGTTLDQTYTAIDPIEEKRIRTKTRKDYRAQRSLWRHQERIERAKNTRYVNRPVNYGIYSALGYGGMRLGFSNFRRFGSGLGCSYYIR